MVDICGGWLGWMGRDGKAGKYLYLREAERNANVITGALETSPSLDPLALTDTTVALYEDCPDCPRRPCSGPGSPPALP